MPEERSFGFAYPSSLWLKNNSQWNRELGIKKDVRSVARPMCTNIHAPDQRIDPEHHGQPRLHLLVDRTRNLSVKRDA